MMLEVKYTYDVSCLLPCIESTPLKVKPYVINYYMMKHKGLTIRNT